MSKTRWAQAALLHFLAVLFGIALFTIWLFLRTPLKTLA